MDLRIERSARVIAGDTEIGRVKHVVVDQVTREVTELVVERDGREWLVSMRDVERAERGAVTLRRGHGGGADGFVRERFDAVTDEVARSETRRSALYGGAPLLDAEDDAVVVGPPVAGDEVITEPVATSGVGSSVSPRPADDEGLFRQRGVTIERVAESETIVIAPTTPPTT